MKKAEISRLKKLLFYEEKARLQGFQQIAGVDEVGRGPLAGPVVAACCILPANYLLENLNDSKQVSVIERERLYTALSTDPKIQYGVGVVEVVEIDRINILQASLFAMQKAVSSLSQPPDYLLVDGNRLPKTDIPGEAVIGGDGKSLSIAAASIIAKVTRDRMLERLDEEYPLYGFKKHKGYATPEHLRAISLYGPCAIHRTTFEPIKSFCNYSDTPSTRP